MNITHVAGFKVTKAELLSTVEINGRVGHICRITDEFDTTLCAVVVDGEIVHETDDEHRARLWFYRNINI